MSEPLEPGYAAAPRWRTQIAIGAALFAVALVVWLDAQRLPAPSAVGVGPSAAMRLVAVLVAVLAAAHWISAWRQRASVRSGAGVESAPVHGNHASLAWVLGGLLGLIAILQLDGGFVAASTWLFVATARGFGQRLSPKSFGIGFGLSALVYVFFTRTLSLALPAGPLERLLG